MSDSNGILPGYGASAPARGQPWPVGVVCLVPTNLLDRDGEPVYVDDVIARVISRGVDCWEWDVMYHGGMVGAVLWGLPDQSGTPLGIVCDNGARIVKARKRRLVAQLTVETRQGFQTHLSLPIPDARGKGEQHETAKLTT